MLPRVNQIRCDNGDFLLFSTNDSISMSLLLTGKWEEPLLTLSRLFLLNIDAPLVLDIGANLGAYTVPVAKEIMARGGSVYAFEVQRIIYYQLCGNVFLNRLDNVFVMNQAVGESDGALEIPEFSFDGNHNVGAFSLNQEYRDRHDVQKHVKPNLCSVPMVRLDSLVLPKSPSLIKVDVEGYEIHVFRGGAAFLEKHKYPPILFEAWGAEWFNEQRKEILEFLGGIGYAVTPIGTMEYVAQHHSNPVRVEFERKPDGNINAFRVR